ncbi:siderophore-interacting protein [Erwinia oleae]|uniref:siderophore-interacting protein n=1 Tax=Erwinia oleae TaxID=796334 RepID=UPI00054FC34A|nr:siderophore-interacting protein [Erwinia oleae]
MQDNHPFSRLPQRVRNELRFRTIDVLSTRQVAGCFNRIEFGGDALKGFNSAGFDDHIKVFFPNGGELNLPEITPEGVVWKDGVRPAARDYTPLAFDGDAGRLTLDFYIHQAGLASDWAVQAKPGDKLTIGGPRGSLVVPEDYAFQLYVCDETGLPAFKRRQQGLSGGDIRLFAFADEAAGRDYLGDTGSVTVSWLGSGAMTLAAADELIAQFASLSLPDNDYFIWLTGEGAAVKKMGDYFIAQRGCEAERVRAVAYWHQK